VSSPLNSAQFNDAKASRALAQKNVREAEGAQQRHPGPLSDLAYTEAVKAYSAAHASFMRVQPSAVLRNSREVDDGHTYDRMCRKCGRDHRMDD
jgi:hypothetical protein